MFKVIEQPAGQQPAKTQSAAAESTTQSQYREAEVREKSVVLPKYPQRALAAKAGAAQVSVRITVNTAGQVVDIRPSPLAMTITPSGFGEDFQSAVATAVRQWQFKPARVEHIEIVSAKGFTYSRRTGTEAVSAELDLSFSFTLSGKVEATTSNRQPVSPK